MGLRGCQPLKRLAFEDEYRGAEDQAKLQGPRYNKPLIRSTVDVTS